MVLRKAPGAGFTPPFLAPPFAQQNHGGEDFKRSLTFSLDLKHADCVLRVERPDFAGGQCVSPLDAGRDCERRRLRLHELDEWLRASDGHPMTKQHLLSPSAQCTPTFLCASKWRITTAGSWQRTTGWAGYVLYSVWAAAVVIQTLICM